MQNETMTKTRTHSSKTKTHSSTIVYSTSTSAEIQFTPTAREGPITGDEPVRDVNPENPF